jgi:hypothetical protein
VHARSVGPGAGGLRRGFDRWPPPKLVVVLAVPVYGRGLATFSARVRASLARRFRSSKPFLNSSTAFLSGAFSGSALVVFLPLGFFGSPEMCHETFALGAPPAILN